MPFTVEEFRDLISILKERPEWREELRRFVLADELLSLPEQIARLRRDTDQRFQELAVQIGQLVEAQRRTEERVGRLEETVTQLVEAQRRTEERVGRLEETVTQLAEAQRRTEERVGRLEETVTQLAEAQRRTEERVGRLEETVTRLAQAQKHTEEQVATLTGQVTTLTGQVATLTVQMTELTRTVHTLTDDVGELKGKSLEADYRTKVFSYFGRLLSRVHVLSSDELTTLLDEAIDAGVLSALEAQEISLADVVVRGKRRQDGAEMYLVVEVSWGVGPGDVERAVHRAELFSRTGVIAIPVVAGRRVTPEAAELAQADKVWQLTDGRAVMPESGATPL
ncbi:MAG TPA: hypothetical protein VNN62_23840 [Methylomirabilota bacterium]|nr:hypothetical protein [Methylomirabilota bacterium]